MKLTKIIAEIEEELKKVLSKINEKKTENFIKKLLTVKKIFSVGQGRSNLVAKAFAMRLMQLGMKSYVVGETITPSIGKQDLLIAISSSGETQLTYNVVQEAKKAKAKICLITANKKSKIAKKSDLVIEIKAKTKVDHKKSIEPLGSLFEQASLLYLDSVIVEIIQRLGKKPEELKKRHANLE